MGTRTSIWCWLQTWVAPVTFMRWRSKGQGQGGSKCLGTGGKIGNPTLTSTGSLCLLRSPQVMVELLSHTMLPLPVGPSVRPSVVPSFTEKTYLPSIPNTVAAYKLLFSYCYNLWLREAYFGKGQFGHFGFYGTQGPRVPLFFFLSKIKATEGSGGL